MIDLKALGSRIRELRQKKGLTQGELAQDLHVSFQAVSNWERGIAPPDVDNLLCLASYFGVLVDMLLSPVGEPLYLGIDGGGTKTEFAVVSSDGRVHKCLKKGSSNPNDVGYESAEGVILDGIKEVLSEYPSVKSIFGGIAGMSAGEYAKMLRAALKHLFPQIAVEITGDARNLFALCDEADMVLISGTGSVSFVKSGDSYRRIGGFGYLFDCAGSAFDIGRDAIRHTLSEEDTGKAPSLLSRMIYEKMGTATAWEHIDALYKGGKPYIASFASVVFSAYRKQDETAVRIVDGNARALAELLNTGSRLYGAKPFAVASGGLFEHYADIMTAHIERYSQVKLTVGEMPPVYGACRNACMAASCQMAEGFSANFQKTYGDLKHERYEY